MSARIIDGKQLSKVKTSELASEVRTLRTQGRRPPSLAVVLVGSDPASELYVEKKKKACESVGIDSQIFHLSDQTEQTEVLSLVRRLSNDETVDGILVQLPLPAHIDNRTIIEAIDPQKDVDGLTVASRGALVDYRSSLVPCTPLGIMHLLSSVEYNLEGCLALVVGRSALVGAPIAELLSQANATVIKAHSKTQNIKQLSSMCDLIIACAGVPKLVDQSWVKPGAVLIDVGIHRTENGLCGDVDFDAVKDLAAQITPVPGGVGPMTIFSLLSNTLSAYKNRTSDSYS